MNQNLSLQRTWKCIICGEKGVGPRRGGEHYAKCLHSQKEENAKIIDQFINASRANREEARRIDQDFDKWLKNAKKE